MLFKKWEKELFWLSIACIVVFSFLFYSYRYYALLNSDDALSVLMTHYYQLPKDIYCWGQNRGGTLVPLVAQLFYRGFHFSAINSVSLTNYLLLFIGFSGFSCLFKNRFTVFIFALFWFLPPVWFIDSLRFPYGVQYCIIGAAVFVINKLAILPKQKIGLRQHLLLGLLILLFTLAIWVSDLASVTVVVLLSSLLFFHFRKNGFSFPHKIVVLYFVSGAALCTSFIIYAKNVLGIKNPDYLKINSFAEAFLGLRITKDSIVELLLFQRNDPLMSLYLYFILVLLAVILISIYKKRISISSVSKKWLFFFLADGIVVFTAILFSRWAMIDGFGRRFFICNYISFGLAVLIITDHLLETVKRKNALKIVLLLTVFTGASSTVYFLRFIHPKSLKPTYETMCEFKTLGECGIIGNYWTSYIISIADPAKIKATPYEGGNNLNDEIVKEVLESKNIYIMKDNWLESYPDTLRQYWHVLYKDGQEFTVGGRSLCRYKIIN